MKDFSCAYAPWVFQVQPLADESFGHYLGRFRRANDLSRAGLAELLAVSAAIVQGWETPSRQQTPDAVQWIALSAVVGIPVAQLQQMLPSRALAMHLSTRLCSACYGEISIHCSRWQQAGVEMCDRHQMPLLSACPACHTAFRLPALWELGCCEHCWLPFEQMGCVASQHCSGGARLVSVESSEV